MNKEYMDTRYSYSAKRQVVWKEICRYFNKRFILHEHKVLEIGCGYGDFIGNITAKTKEAIEIGEVFKPYLEKYGDVNVYYGDSNSILSKMAKSSYDIIFCSNYFEHFNVETVRRQLIWIERLLSDKGRLIIIQPNYQLCSSKYFDDWTHKSVFSHISFSDLLIASGFIIDKCIKGFLPFSFKDRIPVNRLLVRFYLKSRVKPFAAQFLIIASSAKKL